MALADFLLAQLNRHRFALLWGGLIWALAVAAVELSGDLAAGRGLDYPVKDLLISYADGPTRRGLVGTAAILLAGAFGGAPAVWAVVLGSLVTLALFAAVIRLFGRLDDAAGLLPLILGPAGLMFFVYDPAAAFRKEIFGFLSLALVLNGAVAATPRAARLWALAGAALFPVAQLAHEANIFLWPALAAGFWLVWLAHRDRWSLALAALTGAGGAALTAVIAAWPIPDPAVLCQAARVAECTGPFDWLTASSERLMSYVFERRAAWEVPVWAGLAALSCLGVAGLRPAGPEARRLTLAALVLPGVAVLPLFVLGFDWGRWIVMAVLPASLIATVLMVQGRARYRAVLPGWAILIYLGTWGLHHAVLDVLWRGLLLWPLLAVAVPVSALLARGHRAGQKG